MKRYGICGLVKPRSCLIPEYVREAIERLGSLWTSVRFDYKLNCYKCL